MLSGLCPLKLAPAEAHFRFEFVRVVKISSKKYVLTIFFTVLKLIILLDIMNRSMNGFLKI